MAKHALKGMKKAKFRNVRRDMQKQDRKKALLKLKQQEAADRAEQNSRPAPGQSNSKLSLCSIADNRSIASLRPSDQVWVGASRIAGFEVPNCANGMTKKERKEFDSRVNKAVRLYAGPGERLLLVGEGNFSFARALCAPPFAEIVGGDPVENPVAVGGAGGAADENEDVEDKVVKESVPKVTFAEDDDDDAVASKRGLLVATCYDDKQTLIQKYGEGVKQNVKFLKKQKSVEVCVGVDCRRLSDVFGAPASKNKNAPGEQGDSTTTPKTSKFDKIVFQFPHTGSGEQDRAKNIKENQELLEDFFREAAEVLREDLSAEVHVTLKCNETYRDWKIAQCCAKGSNGKLKIKNAFDFDPRCFPGYAHRRTIGFKENLSAKDNEEILKTGAKTYVFVWSGGAGSKNGGSAGTATKRKSGGDTGKGGKKKKRSGKGGASSDED
eukprot:g1153.t1